MKKHLRDPIDFAKTLKLRFRVSDLELSERRKRYTSSRKEEEVDAQMSLWGEAVERRTHILGECEMCKEERDVLEEEVRAMGKCDMEELCTLDSREKTSTVLGDRWWPQAAKQGGDKNSQKFLCNIRIMETTY